MKLKVNEWRPSPESNVGTLQFDSVLFGRLRDYLKNRPDSEEDIPKTFEELLQRLSD